MSKTKSILKEIIFMGTGPSSCLPNVTCLTRQPVECKVCPSSLTSDGFKNKRNNTSVLLKLITADNLEKNILIDCGKTFYNSSLQHFPKNNINLIDAVILTHGHADAINGLDDLRAWCNYTTSKSIPVYLSQDTFKVVEGSFPYIVDRNKATGGGEVSSLDFNIITIDKQFEVEGLTVMPLLVEHGKIGKGEDPYLSLGFKFQNVSYISDCNEIPESTYQLMQGSNTFIVDCLRVDPYSSHFGFKQSMEAIEKLGCKSNYLVGMAHRLDHYDLELDCKKVGESLSLNIEPAYDGLNLKLDEDGRVL